MSGSRFTAAIVVEDEFNRALRHEIADSAGMRRLVRERLTYA